jgi:PKD repeat protein
MTCSKKGAHILFLVAMMAFVISGAAADQPVADFSVQDSFTQGFAPFTAWFLDHSTNAASWSWSFGDGQASTEQNPEHTYSNPGTYTVSLTVTDATGTLSDTKTVTDLIVVGADPMGGGTDTPQTTTTVTPVITTTATTIPATTELPAHYQTSVTVEHGQTVSLDVNLEPVTTTKTTTTTLLPTATTTRVPTVMETSTAEAMKAAAAPGSESGPGSIRINCAGCLERKSGGTPVSFIHYMILSVHYPDGKETKQVMYSEYRTEEAVKTEVPPGYYEVRVWPEDYKAQSRYITVRQSEESAVVFNGSGFVQTPGFGALIAVLTVALIAGLRRFQFGS